MTKVLLLLGITLVAAGPVDQAVVYTENADMNPEETSGLFEGDIDLQPGENPLHRNAIADRNRRWANGVVPYEISSTYPSTVQNIFHQAMTEIEERTKVNGKTCIKFQPHNRETGYISFVNGTGCYTPVGYIGRQSSVTIGHGCERKGTVMHQLLHALGFWNEESRTDRDNYVTIHYDNIQKDYVDYFFNKYPIGYIDMLGQPYDYGSIMHCSAYAFAVDPSKMTVEPKQPGVTIGQRVRLSDIDVKEIQLLYGCISSSGQTGGSGTFVTSVPPATSAPPSGSDVCYFEHNFCHWTQSHSDRTQWRRHAGSTPSANTGPQSDPHGSTTAHYIYIQASGHENQIAKLDSQVYPGGDYCLDFYYHMYGAETCSLRVNVVAGSSIYHLKTWSGDHGNHWNHQRLNAHIHTSGTFKFEIEGHTGSGYHSDIAIDDIIIYPGNC